MFSYCTSIHENLKIFKVYSKNCLNFPFKMLRWWLLNIFLDEEEAKMRLKFNKEYLKYYTYAILGLITLILFYKISDNLGFIQSSIVEISEIRILQIQLPIVICFLIRPKRWMNKQVFKDMKDDFKDLTLKIEFKSSRMMINVNNN